MWREREWKNPAKKNMQPTYANCGWYDNNNKKHQESSISHHSAKFMISFSNRTVFAVRFFWIVLNGWIAEQKMVNVVFIFCAVSGVHFIVCVNQFGCCAPTRFGSVLSTFRFRPFESIWNSFNFDRRRNGMFFVQTSVPILCPLKTINTHLGNKKRSVPIKILLIKHAFRSRFFESFCFVLFSFNSNK